MLEFAPTVDYRCHDLLLEEMLMSLNDTIALSVRP